MPRWLQHARQLAGLQRRWSVQTRFGEVLDGIMPVLQVDKHRDATDQNIYGMLVQSTGDGANYMALALVPQSLEVLVHKIELVPGDWSYVLRFWHLFTPLRGYTPFDVASNAYFSWTQGEANLQDDAKIGNAFGVGGLGSAQQVVIVNGVPVTTIGPVYAGDLPIFGSATDVNFRPVVIWSFQDPPIRLKPFTMLCVQSVFLPAAGTQMNVNFYWSQRVAQGDVG